MPRRAIVRLTKDKEVFYRITRERFMNEVSGIGSAHKDAQSDRSPIIPLDEVQNVVGKVLEYLVDGNVKVANKEVVGLLQDTDVNEANVNNLLPHLIEGAHHLIESLKIYNIHFPSPQLNMTCPSTSIYMFQRSNSMSCRLGIFRNTFLKKTIQKQIAFEIPRRDRRNWCKESV